MNKPIKMRCADIYLRFPEIMEEEANDLADFLEDEHIVYEGATDVFIEKDKEIERLNNIINELEKELLRKLEAVKYLKDTLGDNVYVLNPHIDLLETEYNYFSNKLKELKEK